MFIMNSQYDLSINKYNTNIYYKKHDILKKFILNLDNKSTESNNLHKNFNANNSINPVKYNTSLFYNQYYSNSYNLLHFFPELLEETSNKHNNSIILDDHLKKSNNTEEKIKKEFVVINTEINSLADLLTLCEKFPLLDNIEYNINMQTIHKINPYLQELNDMIGMKSIKENIVDQILYFVQNLHCVSQNDSDYMHTVIYGPPGTGKTEVAKIMGKIFSNIGVLQNKVFKKVTRDDLVAGFLGQTAIKTKEIIKETIGGVLFIDEAYALGNNETRDSFSKECIDTLCEALSDHKKDFMCIIAGYEKEIRECFFSYNDGLESRFIWKFKIDDYSAEELKMIFEKKIKDSGWSIKEPLDVEWFQKNLESFKYYGRDIETLFSKVKIAHSRRVFCLQKEDKTHITKMDLEKGFQMFVNNDEIEKRKQKKEQERMLHYSLYS